MSGSALDRIRLAIARPRALPALTCVSAPGTLPNITSVWPPMSAVSACGLPGYGTCVAWNLFCVRNSSIARCCGLPTPSEP